MPATVCGTALAYTIFSIFTLTIKTNKKNDAAF